METNNQLTTSGGTSLIKTDEHLQNQFIALCQEAGELQLADDVTYTFKAAAVIQSLRNLLTKSVVEHYFLPLMGTRIGFLTDRDKEGKDGKKPAPYDWETVRDCIIDGACRGLAPVANQINIIAGNMYPTKEGYTALLKRIGAKYFITKSEDKAAPGSATAKIECKIYFEHNGIKSDYTYTATPKKNQFSSLDQLQGKAERKAKKSLYEYITGIDLGDADEDSGAVEDQSQAVADRKSLIRGKESQAPQLL
ncbi:MAG: hypothetical protein MJY49_03135 [Bacteroidales bacterium]|nr:hypothetical protein [Bacteroidales bacterium]